ncbi:MAG: type II secretion system F family protein [Candidatus Methylacidiphilales bacterium]|nr:type II secretion system F family protein [Candidatus Methylacidiphilales bacterium]
MPSFTYTAVASGGKRVQGTLEAPSRQAALQQLDGKSLQPVSLKAVENSVSMAAGGSVKLSQAQVILFSEDVADLLDAGLQLEAALKVVEERPGAGNLQIVAARARRLVREGTPFATALRQASPSFGELYCSMIAAGEASGVMGDMMRRQINYLRVMQELRSQMQQALIYPAFICGAGGVVLILFMTVLLPQLESLFAQTKGHLPLLTQWLILAARFVTAWWPVLLGIGTAIGFAWRQWVRTPRGRAWWDERQLSLPVFGSLLMVRFYAQFAHTLGSLAANGIPLLQGMKLTAQATQNVFLRAKMDRMGDAVGDGGSLSRAMKVAGIFPQLFTDMVGVGERTGDLPRALERAAQRYDKEMQSGLTRMMGLIQPTVILVIALGVGLVAYSVVNTIMEAVSSLKVQR